MDEFYNSPNAVITSYDVNEFFEFGDFKSKEMGYIIQKREAPTPSEKEIVETIPFMQGSLDFSFMFNERFYENREVKYTLVAFNLSFNERSRLESETKSLLMKHFDEALYETFQNNYHWVGKVKQIEFEHDDKFQKLQCVITFDVYPFAIANFGGFDDVWDTFDFDNGIANWTKYKISGTKTISLFNGGDRSIPITVNSEGSFTVLKTNGDSFTFDNGRHDKTSLTLEKGINVLNVSGNGTISFGVHEEVMA